ncbi:hypothetical protein D7V77_04030 [Corallococcus sp. CA041A]|uniref:hypothetical protein n=1 Tax=Corallococcus TaxID=83461 RepID=UPI000EA0BD21|nr:hypothetical protein [Corallococcus sp. CA041A]RKH30054.1 hypothetical protein D7V77_04030 [Corallococcus sp. CA041A]
MSQVPEALHSRFDVHDRKQFEIKLEYQPTGADETRYLVEAYLFLPSSLNIDAETYPRADFYADIHNYVRFKTPVMGLGELLSSEGSPLVKLEAWQRIGLAPESDVVYQAKLFSCVLRGALRRFATTVETRCDAKTGEAGRVDLETVVRQAGESVPVVLERFRAWLRATGEAKLQEKTRASLRLVDEYVSLLVEQFFRRAVADMDALPRTGPWLPLRKGLMEAVLREESYRKEHRLRSVLSPTGDNEEYMQRLGFLKKFCMNVLFLSSRRRQRRQGWEEVLFAIAAGVAMAFATSVALWAQVRFTQVSLNFFLVAVVGYMMKDRIKEGLRRMFSRVAATHLYDRTTDLVDPVTARAIGICEERVDYGAAVKVPQAVSSLRLQDDFLTVSQGELSEAVIRYQKRIVLDARLLPRSERGLTGVTDILRLNVGRFLRDMDEPEFALEYVDLEDFSVGHIRGAKRYPVDLVFRFTVMEDGVRHESAQLVRLVLDRNGIQRMQNFARAPEAPVGARVEASEPTGSLPIRPAALRQGA